MEELKFSNLDQTALYAVKSIKRLVKTQVGGTTKAKQLNVLIQVLEFNINELELPKSLFFATIRDYARIFHDEWCNFEIKYNTYLLAIALKLGLDKIWTPDGGRTLTEADVFETIACLYKNRKPVFSITSLNQNEGLFDYFAKHSPKLEKIVMPTSDNDFFTKCMQYENLAVIELAGGVSDKILCNALWSKPKKSNVILDLALTKDTKSWKLSLPHLRVLKSNILQENQPGAMRITLGATALAIQPKMETVECVDFWTTYDAIVHLHLAEKNLKICGTVRSLNVKYLSFNFDDNIRHHEIKAVVADCPLLTGIHLTYMSIYKNLNMFAKYPALSEPLKEVSIEVSELSSMELSVLLQRMSNVEKLTLQLQPIVLVSLNFPRPPAANLADIDIEEYKKKCTIPPLKTLVLEFTSGQDESRYRTDDEDYILSVTCVQSYIDFISSFVTIQELYIRNSVALMPPPLVYGCLGGVPAVLSKLKHISIIAISEYLPGPIPGEFSQFFENKMTHFPNVKRLLQDLLDDVIFKHLEKLTSLEIDEYYACPQLDSVIKALRLSGVHVSIMYRKALK